MSIKDTIKKLKLKSDKLERNYQKLFKKHRETQDRKYFDEYVVINNNRNAILDAIQDLEKVK